MHRSGLRSFDNAQGMEKSTINDSVICRAFCCDTGYSKKHNKWLGHLSCFLLWHRVQQKALQMSGHLSCPQFHLTNKFVTSTDSCYVGRETWHVIFLKTKSIINLSSVTKCELKAIKRWDKNISLFNVLKKQRTNKEILKSETVPEI